MTTRGSEDPERFADATLLSGNGPLTKALLALVGLVVVGVVTALAKGPVGKDGAAFLRLMTYLVFGGLFGAYWSARVVRRPTARRGELVIGPEAIELAGAELVRRRDVRAAVVLPEPDGATVRLERGFVAGPLDLRVDSVATGRAIVRALALDASRAATDVTILSVSTAQADARRRGVVAASIAAVALLVGTLAAIKAHLGALAGVGGLGLLVSYAFILALRFRSGRATVGADGVALRALFTRTFVPIKEIEGAEVRTDHQRTVVRIHRRGAAPLDVVVGVRGSPTLGARPAELLAERIEEAVAARGVGGAAVAIDDPEGLLARGDRPVEAWIAELRALRDRVPTFRAPGLFERLWDVLEDVRATPTQRAAAAVALAPHVDAAGKERLRVAAQAAAAPKLRVALEAAAAEDDARLADALAEAEAELRA